MSDNDSSKYIHATITIKIGILSINAIDETKPPKASEPVSPINTLAGYTLYKKNPSNAPTKAAEIGSKPDFVPAATAVKNTAIITVTLVAKPSRPSVKFAPFTVPKTAINKNGINNHIGIVTSIPFVKGIIVAVPRPEYLTI